MGRTKEHLVVFVWFGLDAPDRTKVQTHLVIVGQIAAAVKEIR